MEEKKNLEAIQYCAGLFDAEGSIGYYKRQKYEKFKAELAVQMAHKPCVEFIARTLGGGGDINISKREGKKDMYRWRVSRESEIERVGKILLPHLVIKSEEMQYLLKALDSRDYNAQQSLAQAMMLLKHTSFAGDTSLDPEKETGTLSDGYVAGYIDGDGSFEDSNTQRNSVRVSSANCCPIVLLRLAKRFGGSVRLNRLQTTKKRTSWKWTMCGKRKVQRLLDLVQAKLLEKAAAAQRARAQCEKADTGCGPRERF